MRMKRFLWLTVSLAAVVVLAAILVMILARRPRSRDLDPGVLSADTHTATQAAAGPAPDCAPLTGPVPTTILIGTQTAPGDSFDRNCYYAAAGQQLSIRFTNSVYARATNAPTTMTLLISPSQDPAIATVPNNPMFGTIDTSKAVFTGTPVVAPATGVMSVPALPAGSYDLQILEMPTNFIATLVVQ